jgi:glycine cleavage system aminomethyltransferase T
VAGNDRASFLQGLLTNDVQALKPGEGCYAAWLTPQGRMLTDLHVLESDGMMLLDVPAAQADATLARLEQFLFSEDVRLGSLAGALTTVWVHGPGAASALEQSLDGVAGIGAWAQYHHEHVGFAGESLVLARVDQLAVPGFCAYLSAANRGALLAALEAAGARQVGPEAIAAARIEAGYPIFGADMTADTIRSRRASSRGDLHDQGVLRRSGSDHPGTAPRTRPGGATAGGAESSRPTARKRARRSSNGDREVGFVTSVATSPVSGPIALGYVHRDLAVADARVSVDTPAGRLPATVMGQPIRSSDQGPGPKD